MCDCIREMNEELALDNAELDIPWLFRFEGGPWPRDLVTIRIRKLDPGKRKRLPLLGARFCPFCGEAYRGAQVALETATTHRG